MNENGRQGHGFELDESLLDAMAEFEELYGDEETGMQPEQYVPEEAYVQPEQYVPEETYVQPEQYVPEETYVQPEQYVPEETYVQPEQYVPGTVYVQSEQYVPEETYVQPEQQVQEEQISEMVTPTVNDSATKVTTEITSDLEVSLFEDIEENAEENAEENVEEKVETNSAETKPAETKPAEELSSTKKQEDIKQLDSDRKGTKDKREKKVSIVAIVASIVLVIGMIGGVAWWQRDAIKGFLAREKTATTEEVEVVQEPTEEVEVTTTEEHYDGWIYEAKVINPTMTDKTISIPAADLSVFNITETAEGEENQVDPWALVSLNMESVEGSINKTSPGIPEETTKLTSTYMVLVDLDTEEIVAERNCEKVVPPASMTKILTVLTARDYIDESKLDEKFTITGDIIAEAQNSGLSAVGFLPGDEVTVRDMLYGTIVCSGADAAMGLAEYCAGSQEAFVERMNENVKELGLSDTAHFTNVVGKYDENLNCTMTDMAVILSVAMQDELLRDVLSTRIYHTDIKYPDLDMPNGMEISNWFLRRIEDKEMPGEVIGAKTGFVNQSGFCSASYFEASNGKRYICVTGNANSSWRAIYDHVGVYRCYVPQ